MMYLWYIICCPLTTQHQSFDTFLQSFFSLTFPPTLLLRWQLSPSLPLSLCLPSGQVADGQTADGPHAVVLTRLGWRVGGTVPRRAACPWGAAGKRPWGVWVWLWEADDGAKTSPDCHHVWNSPQICWRGLTACNKSPDLTPGQCCHSVEEKTIFLGAFYSKACTTPGFVVTLCFSVLSTHMLLYGGWRGFTFSDINMECKWDLD